MNKKEIKFMKEFGNNSKKQNKNKNKKKNSKIKKNHSV